MPDILPQSIVEKVMDLTAPVEGALLVGGQALNFWAERYSEKAPELSDYAPFASKDIDFFGTGTVAAKIAERLGGRVQYPKENDHTPNAAVVHATIEGHELEIDILSHVIGPPADKLLKQMVIMDFPMRSGGDETAIALAVMHPLHCLQSRAANVITLGRKYDVAKRQLNAAPIVLREYISEALGDGSDPNRTRVATSVLKSLDAYLQTDIVGRHLHMRMKNNPLGVIRAFEGDPRLDERYRENQLKRMITDISARQARDRNQMAAVAMGQGIPR